MGDVVIGQSALGAYDRIGKGATSTVFRLHQPIVSDHSRACVFKKYKRPDQVDIDGLLDLVRSRDQMSAERRAHLDQRSTWPLKVVVDNPVQLRAVGLVLPLIPDEFFVEIHHTRAGSKPTRKPAELQFLFCSKDDCERLKLHFLTFEERLHVLQDLAYVLGFLHRMKVIYGDLSALNVLYRHQPVPGAMLIDCDAVRMDGNRAPNGRQLHTDSWEPPETLVVAGQRARLAEELRGRDAHAYAQTLREREAAQSRSTDCYKFALAFLRVMAAGACRSDERNPEVVRRHLPHGLWTLLKESLEAPASDRPPLADWYDEIGRTLGKPVIGRTQLHPEERRLPPATSQWRQEADGTLIRRRPGSSS